MGTRETRAFFPDIATIKVFRTAKHLLQQEHSTNVLLSPYSIPSMEFNYFFFVC